MQFISETLLNEKGYTNLKIIFATVGTNSMNQILNEINALSDVVNIELNLFDETYIIILCCQGLYKRTYL